MPGKKGYNKPSTTSAMKSSVKKKKKK